MRIICVWRRESDYGRATEEWLTEFERRTGREVESYDPDAAEGEDICRTYSVVEYPTILAVDNNGTALESWRGKDLPLFDQVNYWAAK